MEEVVKSGRAGNALLTPKVEYLLSTGRSRLNRAKLEKGPQEMTCHSDRATKSSEQKQPKVHMAKGEALDRDQDCCMLIS